MGWRRAAFAIGVLGWALACGKTMSDDPDGGVDGGDSCLFGGVRYPKGPVPSGDCNACYCDPAMGGAVSCTTRLCPDGAVVPVVDSSVPEAGPARGLWVDGVACAVTKNDLAMGQPPDGHFWVFDVEASCGAIGAVVLRVTGYDNRGYPLDCKGTPSKGVAAVRVEVSSEDAAAPYLAGDSVGSCSITSGPAVGSPTKPYVYATVIRDADSRMIRYAP